MHKYLVRDFPRSELFTKLNSQLRKTETNGMFGLGVLKISTHYWASN